MIYSFIHLFVSVVIAATGAFFRVDIDTNDAELYFCCFLFVIAAAGALFQVSINNNKDNARHIARHVVTKGFVCTHRGLLALWIC